MSRVIRQKQTRMLKIPYLELAFQGINKNFGDHNTMMADLEDIFKMNVSVISNNSSLAIDLALGAGGLPRGRIVEQFEGPESSGKKHFLLNDC